MANIYKLQLHNHNSMLASRIAAMEKEIESMDCHVILDDSSLIPMHKIIMAICSPYLRELISTFPTEQGSNIMYMHGVFREDLILLRSFMYSGQVSVPKNQLSSVLSTGKFLKIPTFESIELAEFRSEEEENEV